ncbi:JmjC domain-containing protein [Chloropicon primus]|nr:JmjC domain-containing protein [Chloropicon primus]
MLRHSLSVQDRSGASYSPLHSSGRALPGARSGQAKSLLCNEERGKMMVALGFLGLFFGLHFILSGGTSSPAKRKINIVPILRVPADSIGSTKEFFKKYGDQVVIVENGVRHHKALELGWQGLKDLCGEGVMETNKYSKNSSAWAGLTETKLMHLGDYVDNYILSPKEEAQMRYASGNVGTGEVCPRLDLYAPIPKYVANVLYSSDKVSRGPDGEFVRNLLTQPEVFIGPKGSLTEMHMDTGYTPFWMSVYIGKKIFRTISYEDSSVYLPFYRSARRWKRLVGGVTKHFEVWNPDLETFPSLGRVTIQEGAVNAGDWIHLPPATLHGVFNAESSWAVSMNSLPPALLDRFLRICVAEDESQHCGDWMRSLVPVGKDLRQCVTTPEGGSIMSSFLHDSAGGVQEEDFRKCYDESPVAQHVQREYDHGEDRDKHIYEISGFKDWQSWCEAVCRASQETEDMVEFQKQGVKHICDSCNNFVHP